MSMFSPVICSVCYLKRTILYISMTSGQGTECSLLSKVSVSSGFIANYVF